MSKLHGDRAVRAVYPRYIAQENNGDGKDSTGYSDDWEKGIAMIIEAFEIGPVFVKPPS